MYLIPMTITTWPTPHQLTLVTPVLFRYVVKRPGMRAARASIHAQRTQKAWVSDTL